ncbi:MAG: DUF1232 domain-containing protein [Pseudomonadales bacterium]|nr:DUF1232 domain-containing protein [Pseudomonadales bacterium]
METSTKDYSAFYSPQLVMSVLNRAFSKAGLDVVSRVLQLYYLAKSPDLPVWAKASVFAALGYFVVSPDAVPDILPVMGFADDLVILSSTLAGLSAQITPEIRDKVTTKLSRWFGKAELAEYEKNQINDVQKKT